MSEFGLARSLAVIVPAYNEAPRLGRVLDVLLQFPGAARILVVDDGSQDETATVVAHYSAQDPRVEVLRLPENRGKAGAMLAGAEHCAEPLLLFLDADLIGLKLEHLWALCEPVEAEAAHMSVALFEAGRAHTNMSHRLVPFISGQRCMRREDALRALAPVADCRFAVETALTVYARRARLRTRYVPWRGITHWTKEEKRGLLSGAWARCRMYGQIADWVMDSIGGQFVYLARRFIPQSVWQPVFTTSTAAWANRLTVLLLIALVVMYLFTGYESTQAYAGLRMHALESINLAAYPRIMVVAPHPDDEVLSAGGVIHDALQMGSEVAVIVVTNGDGSRSTAITNTRRPYPTAGDYRRMGMQRQLETLRALQRFGLDEEQVHFFCFPDRGLYSLWSQHWPADKPYRSPFTEQSAAYCDPSGQPVAPYAGATLLELLRMAIADFRPDAVIYPHPYDSHTDHAAISSFTTLAIGLTVQADPGYRPDAFTYLVWYSGFPQPSGPNLREPLFPPRCLLPGDWVWVYLTPTACQAKQAALIDYQSQRLTLGRFMDSFVRAQELFERPLISDVPWLGAEVASAETVMESGADPSDLPVLFSVPHRRHLFSRLQPGVRLESVRVAVNADTLWIGLQAREPIQRSTTFTVNLRTFEDGSLLETQVKYRPGRSVSGVASELRGEHLVLAIPRQVLDEEALFMIQVESRWRDLVVVDRSAWYLLRVESSAWEPE